MSVGTSKGDVVHLVACLLSAGRPGQREPVIDVLDKGRPGHDYEAIVTVDGIRWRLVDRRHWKLLERLP